MSGASAIYLLSSSSLSTGRLDVGCLMLRREAAMVRIWCHVPQAKVYPTHALTFPGPSCRFTVKGHIKDEQIKCQYCMKLAWDWPISNPWRNLRLPYQLIAGRCFSEIQSHVREDLTNMGMRLIFKSFLPFIHPQPSTSSTLTYISFISRYN